MMFRFKKLMNKEMKEKYPSPENAKRYKLPDSRVSYTRKFYVGDLSGKNGEFASPAYVKGYLTLGFYPDGKLGEIFVKVSKQGSFVSGILDAFAIAFSVALQYGAPPQKIIDKFKHSHFEPLGFTDSKKFRMASSVLDHLMKLIEETCKEIEGKIRDGGK